MFIVILVYLISLIINAFIVRHLNRVVGSPGTDESVWRCVLGPLLWLLIVVFWSYAVLTEANLWRRVKDAAHDWFNPTQK